MKKVSRKLAMAHSERSLVRLWAESFHDDAHSFSVIEELVLGNETHSLSAQFIWERRIRRYFYCHMPRDPRISAGISSWRSPVTNSLLWEANGQISRDWNSWNIRVHFESTDFWNVTPITLVCYRWLILLLYAYCQRLELLWSLHSKIQVWTSSV